MGLEIPYMGPIFSTASPLTRRKPNPRHGGRVDRSLRSSNRIGDGERREEEEATGGGRRRRWRFARRWSGCARTARWWSAGASCSSSARPTPSTSSARASPRSPRPPPPATPHLRRCSPTHPRLSPPPLRSKETPPLPSLLISSYFHILYLLLWSGVVSYCICAERIRLENSGK